jgi:hypothetical protein
VVITARGSIQQIEDGIDILIDEAIKAYKDPNKFKVIVLVSPHIHDYNNNNGIVSVATYFSSTVAFEMFSLSNQYTAAITDMERFTSLAAGQAMLPTHGKEELKTL